MSSIVSLVVPFISLVIARSSWSRVFNNVDFPVLVLPIIATGTPFFITLPNLKECTRLVT